MTHWLREHRAPALVTCWAGLLLLVVLGRMMFVGLYSESVPFWDQWDAEGAFLLKPWAEGTWSPARLFDAHNEHRIAFSRLISLALFELNAGQWDNLVSAFANTLIYGAVAVLVFELFRRNTPSLRATVLLFLAVLALAWLPFGWENTLVGFQNQFYLMNGFAVATVAVAAFGANGPRTTVGLVLLATLGLFTMASGLLAAIAAGAVLVLRVWLRELPPRRALVTVAALAVLAVAAYAIVPVLPQHQALKAPDLISWMKAVCVTAGWPLPWGYWGALLLWAPTALFLLRLLLSRTAERGELFAGGVAFWVLLQCAAIAYSRGADMSSSSSRYTDVLALGLVANLWFALKAFRSQGQRIDGGSRAPDAVVLVAFLAAATAGLYLRIDNDMAFARERHRLSGIQTDNVRAFVQDRDRSHLKVPPLQIPYPDDERLSQLLSDTTLRAILPATVRAPLPLGVGSGEGAFALPAARASGGFNSCGQQLCSQAVGRWSSSALRSRFPFVEVPTLTGGSPRDLAIASVETRVDAGARFTPIESAGAATHFLPVGAGEFHIALSDQNPSGWIAIGAPSEIGPLSVLARKLQASIREFARHSYDPETSLGSRIELPFKDEANLPIALETGQPIEGTLQPTRDGVVAQASLFIGNFGGQSDGDLQVQLCNQSTCARAHKPLPGAVDNSYITLALDEPIRVHRGQELRLVVSTAHATHRLALWTYPALPGSARVASLGAAGDRTIRVALTYLN